MCYQDMYYLLCPDYFLANYYTADVSPKQCEWAVDAVYIFLIYK